MKTYLVTGAAGFIASKVCELLLADGQEVLGIDNLNDAYDTRLKHWRLEQLRNTPNFTFQQLDICQYNQLRDSFPPKCDAVINLAARAGVRQSLKDPWIYIKTNVTGTLNLLELCKEFGVKKFVLASTSSIYGSSLSVPFREDALAAEPLSPYAASKKGAEALCHSYHHLYGIDTTIFRYFTVYGPAGRPDMSLFRFVQWISKGQKVTVFGDGQQTRDFTYVDDIASGTVKGLRPLDYEIINLGSDKPIVLLEVIRLIEKLLNKEAQLEFVPRHPADVTSTWADISKARRLLDWRPSHTFRQGVEALVSWYQENESWAKNIVV